MLNEIRHCFDKLEQDAGRVGGGGRRRDLLTKLTETMRKKRSELQLHRDDGLELHECFSLDDPVVPLDLPEQWDERTGKALDMEKVVKGRLKELQKLKERGVHVHVPREDAMQDCTVMFVKTRWVQTAKGDEVRCRFVAQEFAKGDPREDLFAGTPPLFAARMLVSRTASSPEPRCTLMVLDCILTCDINRRVYIKLPAEDPGSIGWKVVGKLEKALYGTRDAPQAWLDELSKTLVEIGFTMSARFPGLHFHERLEVALVTHVDDLLCSGSEENLNWVRAELSKKYEVKGQVMAEGNTEIKFLGRTIRRNERGFYWEEDSEHRDILLEEWGLVYCNGVSTLVATTEQCEEDKVNMQDFDATTYRMSAARLNYLAQDRPDIAFAANFLARSMAHPRVGDEVRMKRVIRYLKAHLHCRLGDAEAGNSVERQRLGRGSGHPPKHQWGDDLSWCSSFAVRKPFAQDGDPQLWRSRT